MKKFIKKLKNSKLHPIFKILFMILADAEYYFFTFKFFLQGYKKPAEEECRYVCENVTFMYKSFERKRLAKQLYKNIQHYYPGAKVIIADDSRKPLHIKGEYVTVINLPFNSGLSYGLNQALKEVKTPYLVKLDDDILLTRKTDIHNQLKFLEENRNADLIGFGWISAPNCKPPLNNASNYFNIKYNKKLIIPHLTNLDKKHIVVFKSQNTYIARTDKVRAVGWDDNIRMIDHNEFFYRAAGVIISVLAPDTVLFHRHNPFDKNYMKYRSDISDDLEYIRKKYSIRR